MNKPIARLTPLAVALALGFVTVHASAISLSTTGAAKQTTTYVNDFKGHTSFGSSYGLGAIELKADGSSPFWAYCIDPKSTYKGSGDYYTAASLSSFLNTPLGVYGTAYHQQMSSSGYSGLTYSEQSAALVEGSLVSLFSHAYSDSLTSALKSAAFGYAVWEIMGESSYGRTTGALRSSGWNTTYSAVGAGDPLEKQIDAYLAALNSGNWSSVNGSDLSAATAYKYTVYYDPKPHTTQNFIRVDEIPGGGGDVPEPASLALLGVALAGAGWARRRAKLRA